MAILDLFNNDPEERESEDIEVKLLLEAVFFKYGFDFRGYSRLSVKRQILKIVRDENLAHISELQHKLIWDADFFYHILPRFSINVTEHFRDPEFYRAFRGKVVPLLKTYPSVKFWHAGCSTGQEVYSMAILLQEEDLYDRARIYATDINTKALEIAKAGAYSSIGLVKDSNNYIQAGGTKSFSNYYSENEKEFIMNEDLRKNVLFVDHNLVSDEIFIEAHVILCRNVLIYFDKQLTKRVVNLFYESLSDRGFLCLGTREPLSRDHCKKQFKGVDLKGKIYQKIPGYSVDYVHK